MKSIIEHPEQHTILVCGATGRQGGAVARRLLEAGWRVRALTRDPHQPNAKALSSKGAKVVQGNLNDRSSLDAAANGVYGVFSVQTSWGDGAETEVRQGKNIADAAHNARIQHFVHSSAGGAERASDVPPQQKKWQVEKHLNKLDLPATVLRPTSFMDNYLAKPMQDAIVQGQLAEPLSPDTRLQRIAVSDIAAFAMLAFGRPNEFIGRSIEIAGDERTMIETAEAFGEALGRLVEHVQVPWKQFREQAGDDVTAMFKWFESEGFQANLDECQRLHPNLRSLEEWIGDDFLNRITDEKDR